MPPNPNLFPMSPTVTPKKKNAKTISQDCLIAQENENYMFNSYVQQLAWERLKTDSIYFNNHLKYEKTQLTSEQYKTDIVSD